MRKPRFKLSKKTTRQKLILANDRLFRELIRLRDKVSQKSFRSENLQVCHFWTRGNLRVRFDEDNACLLTASEHIFWAHVHPAQFREFWIRRLGQDKFDALEIRARYVAPIKEFDLIWINKQLQERLKNLQEVK